MDPNVSLRPVTAVDIPLLERWDRDPAVAGPYDWFGWRDPGRFRRRFETDGYLGADGGLLLVVVDDGPVVGDVSWHAVVGGPNAASRNWNIGVTVDPEWRGRGIGGRAQRLLAEELFATTLAERVEATTDVENSAERRALEKAGFTFEGTLRRCQFRGGAWRDMASYSLLRGE